MTLEDALVQLEKEAGPGGYNDLKMLLQTTLVELELGRMQHEGTMPDTNTDIIAEVFKGAAGGIFRTAADYILPSETQVEGEIGFAILNSKEVDAAEDCNIVRPTKH